MSNEEVELEKKRIREKFFTGTEIGTAKKMCILDSLPKSNPNEKVICYIDYEKDENYTIVTIPFKDDNIEIKIPKDKEAE